jgi:aminoglycoside phosphotransferase (APT) family kinase protein
MVMDKADGSPLLAGLAGGKAFAHLPRLAVAVPETLAITMTRLHFLDPEALRHRLDTCTDVATTVDGMLAHLLSASKEQERPDLADAARWLGYNPPPPAPEVICHGDLHPFNLLVDSHGAITVLDWSAALLGQRAYDVAFTTLVLAEPPLAVPDPLRPVVRAAGRLLARRFVRLYRHHSGVPVNRGSLRWHQAVVCLRALVEVAGWDAHELDARAHHPWLLSGPNFASRVSELTGVTVRPASRSA